MKNVTTLILMMLALSACNKDFLKGDQGMSGTDGAIGIPAPIITPAPVTPEQQKVNDLLADENVYREGLGQAALTQGLGCTLYTITGGERIQSSVAGHNTLTGISQVATYLLTTPINQPDGPITDGMNVLPVSLRSLYQNLYLLRCQGQIVITSTSYYQYDITSDDGSVFYIDGAKLLDDDNAHGSVTVSGTKYLRSGVHTFRLDYSQSGGGGQSLVLRSNGAVIDPMYLFH